MNIKKTEDNDLFCFSLFPPPSSFIILPPPPPPPPTHTHPFPSGSFFAYKIYNVHFQRPKFCGSKSRNNTCFNLFACFSLILKTFYNGHARFTCFHQQRPWFKKFMINFKCGSLTKDHSPFWLLLTSFILGEKKNT